MHISRQAGDFFATFVVSLMAAVETAGCLIHFDLITSSPRPKCSDARVDPSVPT